MPFVLVDPLRSGGIGPLRASVLKVWPYFGPILFIERKNA